MLKSAYSLYNKDNEKESVIKDYLFPEIRAKYDRSATLKNAGLNAISVQSNLRLNKLLDQPGKNNVDRFHTILSDIYLNHKPMFREEPRLEYQPGDQIGEVKMVPQDVKPYVPLFKQLSDDSIRVLLPLCNLIRLVPS